MIATKTLKQVEQEVDIFMFTKLIELEFGYIPADEMCIKLKDEFGLEVSEEELREHYEPSIADMEEDIRLTYRNCVI